MRAVAHRSASRHRAARWAAIVASAALVCGVFASAPAHMWGESAAASDDAIVETFLIPVESPVVEKPDAPAGSDAPAPVAGDGDPQAEQAPDRPEAIDGVTYDSQDGAEHDSVVQTPVQGAGYETIPDVATGESSEPAVGDARTLDGGLGFEVSPMSGPPPATTSSWSASGRILEVTGVGMRPNVTSDPAGLDGVVYVAVPQSPVQTTPPAVPSSLNPSQHYWCTTGAIDANNPSPAVGNCQIRVPVGSAVWVMQYSAPDGYEMLEEVMLGQLLQTVSLNTVRVAFRVATTGATGAVIPVPGDSEANTGSNLSLMPQVINAHSSARMRTNAWPNNAQNTAFPGVCSVKVAMMFDVSSSVTAAQLTQLKSAGQTFVGAATGLGGTQSTVGVYDFASNVRQRGSGLFDISGGAGITAANNAINTIGDGRPTFGADPGNPVSGGAIGTFTNWDAAFRTLAAGGPWDVVLFLTDGDPSMSRNTANNTNVHHDATNFGLSYWLRFINVQNAVASANLVKSQVGPSGQNTHILPIGIGDPSLENLRAISDDDSPRQVSNFTQLAAELQQIISDNCAGSLSVIKRTVDHDDNLISATTNGWEFTATTTEGNYITNLGGGANLSTLTQVTGSAAPGSAVFRIDTGTAPPGRSVTVTETVEPGFTAETVSCVSNQGAITPTGTAANFTLTVAPDAIVTCTVTNKELPPAGATVQVDKEWLVNGTPYEHGDQPEGLDATPTVSTVATPEWGTAHTGFIAGGTVQIGETAAVDPLLLPGCTIDAQQLVEANGAPVSPAVDVSGTNTHTATLVAGANEFLIRNTITCVQTLSLEKSLDVPAFAGTEAEPEDWTLTASATGHPTITGDGEATGSVPADVLYGLSEQLAASAPDDAALFTAQGWFCEQEGSGTLAPGSWSAAGSVSVPLGQSVLCTVTNATASLTLLKYVEDDFASPSTWELQAEAVDPSLPARPSIAGSWTGAPGPVQAAAANTVAVRPDAAYSLSEQTVASAAGMAYLFDRVDVWNPVTGSWEQIADASAITVVAGGHAIYRFVNSPVPPLALPLTGGLASDAFLIVGGTVLALALGFALWHTRRARRPA